MQWSDQAIIISVKKYGEKDMILTVFSKQHGIFNGMVKNASSRKLSYVCQVGNIIEVIWKARLPEHMGVLQLELSEAIASYIMLDSVRLTALISLTDCLYQTIPERVPEEYLYYKLYDLIKALKDEKPEWKAKYILFELELLQHLGFGLDLLTCAATGETQNLIYVSPKSGRAVSQAAGEEYKNKLLKLPNFIKQMNLRASNDEIYQGLLLTGYFLEKYIFVPKLQTIPASRRRLLEKMII